MMMMRSVFYYVLSVEVDSEDLPGYHNYITTSHLHYILGVVGGKTKATSPVLHSTYAFPFTYVRK